MDERTTRNAAELASEIMTDGLLREHSGLHNKRFSNFGKELKKTSYEEISAKNEKRKQEIDLN